MTELEKQIVADLATFLVQSNKELVVAEHNEDYELCGEIHHSIFTRIMDSSIILQIESKGKEKQKDLYEYFKKESDQIYTNMKEHLNFYID